MTTYCQKSFKCKAIRGTLLDACGTVVHGATSTVVSKGLTKVTLTPVYESPTDYLVRNANDELEVNEQGQPLLRWWQVVIDFVTVDPYWINTALGWPLITDESGNVTGWISQEGVTSNFAFEGWQDLAGQACSGANKPYGYRLLPWVLNAQVNGDVALENNVTSFSIQGHTHNLSPWGTGPYNVRLNSSNSAPSPLKVAIGPTQHFLFDQVFLAPPTAQCGAIALP